METNKPGNTTSEYQVQQRAGVISAILMGMGVVMMCGAGIVTAISEVNPTAGVFAGMGLTIVGAVYDALVKTGYIKSRAAAKAAEAAAMKREDTR